MSRATPEITLINFYELGRQPFGLAEPAALLAGDGFRVRCVDLSIQTLDELGFENPMLIGLYLPMHTATRLALELLPKIRALAPRAHLCAFGLYAPMNTEVLRDAGIESVLGGEFEPSLLALAAAVHERPEERHSFDAISLERVDFVRPDRTTLPALERYAGLILPDRSEVRVGFAEASRGCKHLCRHCPVVPVYNGRFRVVPVDIVLADIDQQVAAGARHISFGDPDFLNGPGHALRVVAALHEAHPGVTFDATIKIEHIVRYPQHIEILAASGCLFVITAVESVDDDILARLNKRHVNADFEKAIGIARAAGVSLAPTFMPFTPWTTPANYVELLERLVEYRLVESVPPVQLSIRLLVPAGSRMFEIDGFDRIAGPFDPTSLGHPWHHPDPRVDALHREVSRIAAASGDSGEPRRTTFEKIWSAAHACAGRIAPALPDDVGDPIPTHSEPWYCCAEPTEAQLAAL